jgi:UDP-2-acetamido-2,6-beta-L-arabino-hexul-4-ose reductase
MKVLITGADGFIGSNLCQRLSERKHVETRRFTRRTQIRELPGLLEGVEFVFHLAGVNRADDPQEFISGNTDLTVALCAAIADTAGRTGRKPPMVYASSTQAERDTVYGRSKLAAEQALQVAMRETGQPVRIFRLPNVFGKWARPNYNSAIATFCHNTARGLPIQVHDPAARLNLVYVDDVIGRFCALMDGDIGEDVFCSVDPQYTSTVGELAEIIHRFRESRRTLITERVGTGLTRALYATYVSYLPAESFAYEVAAHADPRGVFVEMLKTWDSGQFSYFTTRPGVTRGGHYHHSKTEKFLVVRGRARFRFRHVQTGESHELETCGDRPIVVETVPGWTHDITNVGEGEMIVMLWANEIFDRNRPDTFAYPL